MHHRLKERLVGAAVLVVIAVIFIPMLLTGPIDSNSINKTNIPERPAEKFSSKLVPLNDSLMPITDTETPDSSNDIANAEPLNQEEPAESDDEIVSNVVEKTVEKVTNEKPAAQEKTINKKVGLTAWVVQLGSFSTKVNADKLNLSLRKEGFPAFVEPLTKKGKTSYRVRVGPEIFRADADALLKSIKTKMKLDGIVLSYP
ncbi:MAG: SPOR domain-containing protein [Gammaproteobacteria bacterium]